MTDPHRHPGSFGSERSSRVIRIAIEEGLLDGGAVSLAIKCRRSIRYCVPVLPGQSQTPSRVQTSVRERSSKIGARWAARFVGIHESKGGGLLSEQGMEKVTSPGDPPDR